jgi:hypothetical protein
MDADRVHAYLQVACAGLGFDIGEVWWMSNDAGTSTVAAIGMSWCDIAYHFILFEIEYRCSFAVFIY